MGEKVVERRATWDDTDCTKRIYFTAYMKWMDDALTEFFRQRGLIYDPAGELVSGGKKVDGTFVIGEYGCRIGSPSHFDDMIRIRVRVKDLREKVAVFEGVFEDPATGKSLAHGQVTFIWVGKDGKSASIPENIRSAL
jgi:YbgC/YbaW family acyl-CoA thioester hydrolase